VGIFVTTLEIYFTFIKVFDVIEATSCRRLPTRSAWVVWQLAYIYILGVVTAMVEA
jgi:hypothetical protein